MEEEMVLAYINELNEKASTLIRQYKYEEAYQLSRKALKQSLKTKYEIGIVTAYLNYARIHYAKADYLKSMQVLTEASELIEKKEEDDELLLDLYNRFAILYIRQGLFDRAEVILKKILNTARKIDNKKFQTITLNNLGYIYTSTKQYNKATTYLNEGLAIAKENEFIEYLLDTEVNLAKISIEQDQLDTAKELLNHVIGEAERTCDYEESMEAYILMAELSYKQCDYYECIEYAQISYDMSKKHNHICQLRDSLKILSNSLAVIGHFNEAYDHLSEYVLVNNQLMNEEKEKKLAKLVVQHDSRRNEREAKTLKHKNEELLKKNIKIKQQREELLRLNEILIKQNQELHKSSITDYLTGIYNRKFIMLKFMEEFSVCEEGGLDLSCIIFDIDKFKGVNDRYGHIFGDFVIKESAKRIVNVLDKKFLMGRFGGDEFIIMLPKTKLENAKEVAKNMLDAVTSEKFSNKVKSVRITISLGVADNKLKSPISVEQMIHNADEALYKAKLNGRNRYECIS